MAKRAFWVRDDLLDRPAITARTIQFFPHPEIAGWTLCGVVGGELTAQEEAAIESLPGIQPIARGGVDRAELFRLLKIAVGNHTARQMRDYWTADEL